MIQSIVLVTLGISFLVHVWFDTGSFESSLALTSNQNLIALLISVSFLRLVTQTNTLENEQLPYGNRALRRTLFGTHLFSSVLNLSAIMIVADRLTQKHSLGKTQFIVLSRAFSTAAFWSPFFAAMAAALTYSPGASIGVLLMVGLPVALIAHLITLQDIKSHQEKFEGYPIHFESLLIPVMLLILVLICRVLFPDMGTLMSITILAPVVTLIILFIRNGMKKNICSFGGHIIYRLPEMVGEISLFLSAGLLAVGISEFFNHSNFVVPFMQFHGNEAALCLLIMILFAVIGVHPIVFIGILGFWLEPLNPSPELLAMVFLFAWGIGLGASPFSGMHLAMQSRYFVKPMDILRWNFPYAMKIMVFAMIALQLLSISIN